jgi:hypothetical protein
MTECQNVDHIEMRVRGRKKDQEKSSIDDIKEMEFKRR